MAITFNHTIVAAKDRQESATFFTELFGLPSAEEFGPFLAVTLNHGVSLDYAQVSDGEEIRPQHYAFLVSEDEFDAIYGRVQSGSWSTGPIPRGTSRRDQPQRRRPRRVLPGSRRALPGDNHPALRIGRRLSREASTSTPSPRSLDNTRGRLPSTEISSAARPSTTGPLLTVRPVGVGGHQPQPAAVAECRHERIRQGHLGVQHREVASFGMDGSCPSAYTMSSSCVT